MSSYYSNEDILDMFPLNYYELNEDEQDKILEEISYSCGISIDRILEILN